MTAAVRPSGPRLRNGRSAVAVLRVRTLEKGRQAALWPAPLAEDLLKAECLAYDTTDAGSVVVPDTALVALQKAAARAGIALVPVGGVR